jgi:hypothetical protein
VLVGRLERAASERLGSWPCGSSICPRPPGTPEPLRIDIEFADHAAGAAQLEALLGVPKRLLRDGEGWATETFTRFGTHKVACFPLRIAGAGAAPDRVVALLTR